MSVECLVYNVNQLEDYKYVVTFARYNNRWILCKHRNRNTWETSGGHIEKGETTLLAAKRELYEETGALDFDIRAVCDYQSCEKSRGTEEIIRSNGQVFLAEVQSLGKLPESEMERADLFETFPPNLTYPEITRAILPYVTGEKLSSS